MKIAIGILVGALLSCFGSVYADAAINIICMHHKPVPDAITISAPAPEDHAIPE